MERENLTEEERLEVRTSRMDAFGRLALAVGFAVLVLLIALDVVDADKLETAVAGVLAIGTLAIAWWKDNDVTLRAIFRKLTGRSGE